MPNTVPLRTSRVQGVLTIELEGDLDCYNAPYVKQRLFKLIDNGETDLVLNLNSVDYVDSMGLGVLVAVHQSTLANGGSLRVLCTNRAIWRVFEITGLQRAFPVFKDEVAFAASLDVK